MEKNATGQAVQSSDLLDSSWLPMGECVHCGRAMEGKPGRSENGITIVGAEPMVYRHAHDHSTECVETRTHRCGPYESWGQYRRWLAIKSNTDMSLNIQKSE